MLNPVTTSDCAVLAEQARTELEHNILPFWAEFADWDRFGFFGASGPDDRPDADADKGCILHARILYTFARAWRQLKKPHYRTLAEHALNALTDYFYQRDSRTFAWMLSADGGVVDNENHLYNTSFVLYALTEWVRASGDADRLDLALQLFRTIESRCKDERNGGYCEAFTPDWQPIPNSKLCDTEDGVVVPKTMNSHLHLMEAYANLARVAPDCGVQPALADLIKLILHRQVSPDGAWFNLYFQADWTVMSGSRSFGHDIEGSWLLWDAVSALAEPGDLRGDVHRVALAMALATQRDGLVDDGSLLNERLPDGSLDKSRVWWVQIEAMVGFVNAWQLSGSADYFSLTERLWQYTQQHLIDGTWEWHWESDANGKPGNQPKVNAWKCPYHNGRGCLELLERLADNT